MIKRYETAYSAGPMPMALIFLEGTFEALPFEVRLMEPWYGCQFVDGKRLKPAQRYEVMRHGYAIVREGDFRARRAA